MKTQFRILAWVFWFLSFISLMGPECMEGYVLWFGCIIGFLICRYKSKTHE